MRWIRPGAAALALAGLAACQTVQTSPTTLEPGQRARVESAVRASLKDPDSARFGRINAGRTAQGPILVCGYVNARNGFGGYSGEAPFFGWLKPDGSFEVRQVATDSGWATATLTNCRAAGVPI